MEMLRFLLIVSLVVLATGRRGHHRYHYHHREKPKGDVSKPEVTGNDKNKPIAVEPDKADKDIDKNPHPNIANPIFEGPVIVKKTLDTETYDDFYFSCNIQWSNPDAHKGEQFEIVFTFDGQPDETGVPSKKTDGSNLSVKLWSHELKGHAGKTVGCKVRSHWKTLKKRSRYQVAEKTYFVGINYSTPDTCLIDGRCFRSGEASRLSRCQKCVPSKSINSWTRDKTETECSDSATFWRRSRTLEKRYRRSGLASDRLERVSRERAA